MKGWMLTGMILAELAASSAGFANTQQVWSIDGGSLQLQLYGKLLADLGIEHAQAFSSVGEVEISLPIGAQGNLEFLTSNGGFDKFREGSLPLAKSTGLSWAGGGIPDTGLRLVPGGDVPPSLYLQDAQGRRWMRFQYGHYSVLKDRLVIEVMDARLGPALASSLGDERLTDVFIGGARLVSQAKWQTRGRKIKGGIDQLAD